MEIKDKVAIVTGASSGIGLSVATLLTKYGAKVALAARSLRRLKILSKKLPGSLAVPADMTDENQIKKLIKKTVRHYGRIDILVNCAGRGYDAPIENIRTKTFREIFELDVVGPLVAMQQVIPSMRKQGKGVIVNLSSGTALMYLPNMAGYSSLKRALGGISLTGREELKKDHISISVVYPYITKTNFEKNTIKHVKNLKSDEYVENDNGFQLPPPDSPDFVAQKILNAIVGEKAEIIVHDWMNRK